MAWAPDYITGADLRAYSRVDLGDDEDELNGDATAASRAVDKTCHRQFGKVDAAEARTYRVERGYIDDCLRWFAVVDDVQDLTGAAVLVDGTDVTADVEWWPLNAAKVGKPYERVILPGSGRQAVITAVWGWTAVPTMVKRAALLQGSRFTARRSAPFGTAGSPDMGSQIRLLDRVDPDVAVMLRGVVRLGRSQ